MPSFSASPGWPAIASPLPVDFARLARFKPSDHGLQALQAWRDRVAERPSALV